MAPNMDELQRTFYRHLFRIAFLEKKGAAFEDLFSRIMAHAHPGDFQLVRPYGKRGDLKCDGYRVGDRTVFQCYGPSTAKLKNLFTKIKVDFEGAVVHWGTRMERWVLVHNADDGPPADATLLLVDLGNAYPAVDLGQISYAELFAIAMGLTAAQLEDLFGSAPSQRTLAALDFEALRPVVTLIQRQQPDEDAPIKAPSQSKLEANDLSQDAAELLR